MELVSVEERMICCGVVWKPAQRRGQDGAW